MATWVRSVKTDTADDIITSGCTWQGQPIDNNWLNNNAAAAVWLAICDSRKTLNNWADAFAMLFNNNNNNFKIV